MTKTVENLTFEAEFSQIWQQLTHNQRRFVVQMLECKTKKEAAEIVGLDPRTVYSWSSVIDDAITLLSENVKDSAVSILAGAAAKAAMIKQTGLDSDDEGMRQAIASEILDRIIGKAQASLDVTSKGESIAPDHNAYSKVLARIEKRLEAENAG